MSMTYPLLYILYCTRICPVQSRWLLLASCLKLLPLPPHFGRSGIPISTTTIEEVVCYKKLLAYTMNCFKYQVFLGPILLLLAWKERHMPVSTKMCCSQGCLCKTFPIDTIFKFFYHNISAYTQTPSLTNIILSSPVSAEDAIK